MTSVIELRRFFVLLLTSVALGGFLFYAAAVVPIGSRVVGVTIQGFVTRQVTVVLNAISVAAVVAWTWELWAGRRARPRRRTRAFAIAIAVIAVCTGILVGLHVRMDRLLDPRDMAVLNASDFYRWHRLYLWCSTVQFIAWLCLVWGMAGEMGDRSSERKGVR